MTWPPWWSARPSARAGLDPDTIDEVILGNANGAGEENRNVARMATLLAGLPLHIPGITVNRLCASGLSAIIMASHMIKSGAADIVIAGGVESMSRAPWVQEKPATAFAKPGPDLRHVHRLALRQPAVHQGRAVPRRQDDVLHAGDGRGSGPGGRHLPRGRRRLRRPLPRTLPRGHRRPAGSRKRSSP